ncbi:transporter substrate-binding domain-containing protein [Actinokineospora iranica]|uniref:Glutamate transport system substrate-binding protein n=1 Tax=Actinokineospora iranica TaxID=1271860 RepID=A0A1G6U4Q6_9PSEU|nr:transporter substrate-binding domain-containing protein [Actinokineospora iranica]SDD35525.1 glutamate transport system substrate-binding protein [Actinokineospora iranica]
MADGDQRPKWVRFAALIAAALVAAGIAVAVWWEQVPTEDELKEQAGLKGKSELVIGVKTDMPGIGFLDPDTGVLSGFDIDIAYLIAADLGFEPSKVRLVEIENEDRSKMRGADGRRVDLVVATYSDTPERAAVGGVSFSFPYLETEQSVLTRKDHRPVLALTELAGESVCTLTTSTSVRAAETAGAKIVYDLTIAGCVDLLRAGKVGSVTTDAAILAGFAQRYPDELRHHDIALEAKELWAVNTGGNEPLRTLVNLALYRSQNDPADKRWEDAYNRHLRPMARHSPEQLIPLDQQRGAVEVEVRQWPWERLAGLMRFAVSSGP